MLMAVLVKDAVDSLPADDQHRYEEGSLGSLLYADDTLLVWVTAPSRRKGMLQRRYPSRGMLQ